MPPDSLVPQLPFSDDLLLGQTVAGKYQLKSIHARGAFGTVYLAHQLFHKQFVRPVAVKVSRQTGLTEETASYLFSDALILAQLMASGHHEGKRHLVPIYDMGLLAEHDGRGFLVMEYVDGLPLLSHIQGAGRIGIASGLRYVKEICRGLAVVHAQGAVHRDLKPDNVLIDRAGVVRLVDFGLASFTDPRLGFAPGSMGTFTYMAPETMLGRSTPAADVYGLGLLMYELFTGGGPHLEVAWSSAESANPEAQYHLKQTLQFPPPSAVHNEIRNDYRWLDGLMLRCLAQNPSRRFRDAGALLAALENCEKGAELPPLDEADAAVDDVSSARPVLPPKDTGNAERIREARRLLAQRAYAQVIDCLDVHRPAEWVALDRHGARILRLLGQAFRGRGDLQAARECLEQLRDAHTQQPLLAPQEFAAALTDLLQCYQGLKLDERARLCEQEARRLVPGTRPAD